MIKKLLITLTILVLALALVACGGDTQPQDTTPPTDEVTEHVHVYEEDIVAPTCTTAGSKKLVCECGDVQSEETLGFADHQPSAADCEKDTVCTVCNEVLTPAAGHTVASYNDVNAATCSAPGKQSGTCLTCGKMIEKDVPATGHVPAKDAAITAAAGGFATTCSICGQNVTVTAQAPAFSLTFDADLAAEAANEIGLEIYKPEGWKIGDFNGSKAFILNSGKPEYINIVDPAKLAALGTFVISFDYATTQEAAAGSAGSVFSLLSNHFNGAQTSVGSIGWGWMIKAIEDNDKLATVTAEFSDANSISFERNVQYKIQLVVSPATKGAHVFVNGSYIGMSIPAANIGGLAEKNASFRFGDGPAFGHIIDNFTISALK